MVEAQGDWKYPPFSGTIAEGKLWGRGTLDTKASLWAMLRAAEELIAEGFVPEQDVYFFSACTEETDGSGADTVSKVLLERGIRFDLVLDEGGMVLDEPISGAKGTFAMIGLGEKGCADLKFIIPSGSAKAFMLIPLIVPMAQVFGISAQLCVVAFAFGDGFSNVFYPTNPALLISLGLAGVDYSDWFKWSWKFQFLNLLLTGAILLLGLCIGY